MIFDFSISNLRLLLLALTSFLFVANLVQSPAYLSREKCARAGNIIFYACLILFFGAMIFALLTPSLLLLWVAIELTTLASAPLIIYHRSANSLEAMWKYLLICSVGIGLALFGTMMILHAQATSNAMWYKAGFVFILAGYGTKTGLAPFHTWLPDAHSESPASVSALLSGSLLNCSFFAIVRFRELMPECTAAFCDGALMTLGVLSVAVAAIFMVRQTDFKRLLAYSSVEHMGLIITLFSLVKKDELVFIALIMHIIAHSFTKTALFHIAGNIYNAFGTRAISTIQGLFITHRKTAMLWIVGILFICAMPPSLLFFTEIALILNAPIYISIVILVFLFIVFAAMTRVLISMTMGEANSKPIKPIKKSHCIVPTILLSLHIVLSIFTIFILFC